MGLQAVIRRKRSFCNQARTSMEVRVAENLLNRQIQADAPNQKLDPGWKPTMYLSVVMDLFNNEIVAYHMSDHNDNQFVLVTLRKALEKGGRH
jgi:transposase InsO family protein